MPKIENYKKKCLTLYLDAEAHEKLTNVAADAGMSKNEVIRRALKEYFEDKRRTKI